MKTLFYCSILVFITAFVACTKNSSDLSNTNITGNWVLVKSVWNSSGIYTTYPAKDSSVLLVFNSKNTYQSLLNNNAVSQGNYSVSNVPNAFVYSYALKLQNLHVTGIFAPLVVSQVNSNGQIVSTDTASFFMNISHDTLTLIPDVAIPAGQEVYTFVKQ